MKKHFSPLLALAVICALAAWWLVRVPQFAAPSGVGGSSAAAAEPPVPGLAEGMGAALGQHASARIGELPSERITAQTDESMLRILVVEQTSGMPVAGARVLLQKQPTDEFEWKEAWERWGDVEPMLANGLGLAFVSDDRGLVFVPQPSRNLWVTANLGEMHGEARVDRDVELCRVEMKNYHSLAIEVQDALGKPAQGVRVALMEGEHGEWWAPWSGMTDSDGRVELCKLEDKLDNEDSRLALGPCLAVATPPQAEFTLANVPVEPLRFVLEAMGSVELVLSDSQGRVLDQAGTLGLGVVRSDSPVAVSESGPHFATARAGRAVFERVGLGLEFEARAEVKGKRFNSRVFAGPLTAGERVRICLPLQRSDTLVRGRALDEQRKPLRAAEIVGNVQGFQGNPYEARFRARTDEQGRFTADIQARFEAAAPVSMALTLASPGSVQQRAVVSVARAGDPTLLDLCDVVFLPLDVLVSGTVVDGHGAAVEGARIEARDAATRQDLTGSTWNARAYSDSRGRFVVASTSRPQEIELSAFAWQQVRPQFVRFPVGSENVVIQFPLGGRLEGRARIPDGFDGELLDFDIEYLRDPHSMSGWETYSDGSFVVPALIAGVLVVRISFGETLLWERSDVEIRAGEITQLGEIDLRDRLFAMTIDVVDEAGRPVQHGTLGWSATPGAESFEELDIPRSGRVRFLSLNSLLSIRVRATGFRSESLDGVRSGDRLVLREGIAVRLTLPSRLPSVDPPLSLRVIWSGAAESDFKGTPVGADGNVLVRLPGPGSFELSWGIHNEPTDTWFFAEDAAQASVVVTESGARQIAALELTSASLLRALEKARGAN